MIALSPKSRDLFRKARAEVSPSDANRDRVRARLSTKLGVAAIGAAIGATTTKTASGATASGGTAVGAIAAKAGTLALVGKIAVPLIVVAAVTATKMDFQGSARSSSTRASVAAIASTTQTQAPVVSVPVISDPPSATVVEVSVDQASVVPVIKPIASSAPISLPAVSVQKAIEEPSTPPAPIASAPVTRGLSDELALVDQIERSLREGDSQRAARLTAEHEKRFPRGALVEEREGASVLSRCLSGARATSGADAFLATHPKSPMRARILTACKEP